jgi:hypothetical protein
VNEGRDANAPHVDDLRVPTQWDGLVDALNAVRRFIGPPRNYQVTRWLILRLLGVVYVFAFLGLILQGPGLLGSHGLTPVASYVDALHANGKTFFDVPSVFMFDASDTALTTWAWLGLVIAIAVAAGYANMPMLLLLWFIYGSFEKTGQLWFAFGWEIQILETTLLAAALAHPWDPRPLKATPPPVISIVMMRWLVFRIMLGAGLIKWRGDACWKDLTCLDWHFETQPIPNPLSPFFHHLPHGVLASGVVANHFVELVCPWLVFGPRPLRLVAAVSMLAFQIVLVLSGNLAFLNWLTIVPILACFDDDAILRVLPHRARDWLRARMAPAPRRNGWLLFGAICIGLLFTRLWTPLFLVLVIVALVFALVRRLDWHQMVAGAFCGLVIWKSWAVVDNLLFVKHQAMNRDFDRLSLVNTYGAFGSVGDVRYEIVIEGTMADDPTDDAEWRAYELPCKPGDVNRRPCVLGPYHRRLDWLIWFSAMDDKLSDAWIVHLVWKLLDGDTTIRGLLANDPFDGKPPKWVRIRRFVYHLQPYSADTWWTRELVDDKWMEPVTKETPGFREALARYHWPSPSTH